MILSYDTLDDLAVVLVPLTGINIRLEGLMIPIRGHFGLFQTK